MKNEIISVVLPVWKTNYEQLRLSIDSIIKQTYDNLEIIIVYRLDPESHNDFESLIDEYHDDHRLKVLIPKKQGFTNSLNEGISNSTGELIARIDSDDYCEINRFEQQLQYKHETKSNIIGSWAYIIDNDGKKIGRIILPETHQDIRKKMMLHCPLLHPSILMDKKMFVDIGLYDPSFNYAEDYELYFRAMSHNYRFHNVPKYLVYIRESAESITRGSQWKKQRQSYIRAKNKAFSEYGFKKPYDILYHLLTPISYFVSPKIALKVKHMTGWYISRDLDY